MLKELWDAFGLPASTMAASAAIYMAAVRAEAESRPEALRDIAKLIRARDEPQDVGAAVLSRISKIFELTFGKKHFSWLCITRSFSATMIFIGFITFDIWLRDDKNLISDFSPGFDASVAQLTASILIVFFSGLLPDYIALLKTRMLLKSAFMRRYGKLALIVVDLFCSISISVVISSFFLFLMGTILFASTRGIANLNLFSTALGAFAVTVKIGLLSGFRTIAYSPQNASIYVAAFYSTIFTSIWSASTIVATLVLRLLLPLRRAISWFFKVDEHPIRAIGMTAGVLIFLCSVVISLIGKIFH